MAQLAYDVWAWAGYQDPVLNWYATAIPVPVPSLQVALPSSLLQRPTPSPCCCRHAAHVLSGAALVLGAPPTLAAVSAHFLETSGADISAVARALFTLAKNHHAATNWYVGQFFDTGHHRVPHVDAPALDGGK